MYDSGNITNRNLAQIQVSDLWVSLGMKYWLSDQVCSSKLQAANLMGFLGNFSVNV